MHLNAGIIFTQLKKRTLEIPALTVQPSVIAQELWKLKRQSNNNLYNLCEDVKMLQIIIIINY